MNNKFSKGEKWIAATGKLSRYCCSPATQPLATMRVVSISGCCFFLVVSYVTILNNDKMKETLNEFVKDVIKKFEEDITDKVFLMIQSDRELFHR